MMISACSFLPIFAGLLSGVYAGSSDARQLQDNFPHSIECTPCAGETGACEIKMNINFFSGQIGYYEIDGCEGVSPTLLLNVNRTYIFDQSDLTNWYHLVGFAYEADGAHVPVDELEPGIPPPGTETGCEQTLSCPAPMYWRDGEYQGEYSNNPELTPIPETPSDDFGLDAVEPLFFHPLADWESYGVFQTSLRFDIDFPQDFFYFCHLHASVSARIKLIDADGNMLNPENTPDLPYEYDVISDYDKNCGTFNISGFQVPNEVCLGKFVCGEDESVFSDCVDSMNCHMMASMTTYNEGVSALFCHQMIPHHQNAVHMAKALLVAEGANLECSTLEIEEEVAPLGCELIPLLYDIINTQNKQIQDMEGVLEQLQASSHANCEEVIFDDLEAVPAARKTREEKDASRKMQEASAFESGIACTPCEGTEGPCEIVMDINFFAGEMGYYTAEGCEGVNPTLYLTVNRTYVFDQSNIGNWYHLIGFAYEADGAHVPTDELEPGIPPPGTGSDCAQTLSCPAPMYWIGEEYQGVYSNNAELVPIPETPSDDFGLDAVEPLFFHPIADWEDYGVFRTSLRFDQTFAQDIFYFCHIHASMSARIKFMDAEGNFLNPSDTPELPYEYDAISSFDAECGTFNLEDWRLPNDQCPEKFVCAGDDDTDAEKQYAECIDSMNCHMLDGMTSNFGGDTLMNGVTDDMVLFFRQMIPHHQNAVNMAKALLKTGEAECDNSQAEDDVLPVGCILGPIARAIINTQNHQIQTMQGLLELGGAEEQSDCDSDGGGPPPPPGTTPSPGTTEPPSPSPPGTTEPPSPSPPGTTEPPSPSPPGTTEPPTSGATIMAWITLAVAAIVGFMLL